MEYLSVIRNLEERLLKADIRNSAQAIAELLDDRFIEFGSSGKVFNKQQVIESLQGESPSERLMIKEFNISILAEGIILVTYRVARSSSNIAEPIYSLRSSIWKLVDNQWKLLFHQGTLTTES